MKLHFTNSFTTNVRILPKLYSRVQHRAKARGRNQSDLCASAIESTMLLIVLV